MKYVGKTPEGWWGDYGPYFTHLERESTRRAMPANPYAFATDKQNYNLTSANSLHDSWLISWSVREVEVRVRESGRRDNRRPIFIEASFLGPIHDRTIHLTYRNVRSYSFEQPAVSDFGPGHSDLLVHEVRIEEPGLFCHELMFANGGTASVTFIEFEHRIALLET